MSESTIVGRAKGAVGACASIIGAVVGGVAVAGYAAYKGIECLADSSQRELERIEKELAMPMPTHLSTAEARKDFNENFSKIKAEVAKIPSMKPHIDSVSRVIALRKSPLIAFVDEKQARQLHEGKIDAKSFNTIFDQAAGKFTQANAKYIVQSVSVAASNSGFTETKTVRSDKGKHVFVMHDEQGRALIADVKESEDGAKVNMDMTGFADGTCRTIMDKILKELEEKNIRLGDVQRRAHYNREGSTAKSVNTEKESATKVYPDEERIQAEMRRKRHHLINRKIKN